MAAPRSNIEQTLGIVDMLILTEVTKDSVIQYICRCYEGQGEESLRALEKVVMSYQNDNHTGKLGVTVKRKTTDRVKVKEMATMENANGLPQQNISLVPFDGGFFLSHAAARMADIRWANSVSASAPGILEPRLRNILLWYLDPAQQKL